MLHKITTCFLFDGQAEKAARFYASIFKKSRIVSSNPLMTLFRLEGQEFLAINGPKCDFTWGISLMVSCATQKEINYYWNNLSADGEEQPCGWLKDKFGVSWQVTPAVLPGLLTAKNKAKADRAMQAMLKMKKLDIAKLKSAFAGRS